ncbi:MAG: phage/plasmid primase, P4 family [Cyanobacteria bacterium P01_F01_bin.13]
MSVSLCASAAAWSALRKNIPELPESHHLEPRHIAHLEKDGISERQAMVAGIFSATPEMAEQLTGHCKAGLIFSYFKPDGLHIYRYGEDEKPFFRLRPDNPVGKAKYLSPKGAPSFIYYPRTTTKVDFENLSGLEVLIAEGEKKSLKATLERLPCIGLGGVTSYRTGDKQGDGSRALGSLVEDIKLTSCQKLIIVFDSDITHKWQVANAIKSLTHDLLEAYQQLEQQQLGSNTVKPNETIKLANKLRFALLPNRLAVASESSDDECQKVGIDDALVLFGKANVQKLIDNSLKLVTASWEGQNEGLKIKCLFAAEPCGDYAPKKIEVENQRNYRSLVYWMAAKYCYANVSDFGYMSYSPAEGIWKLISKDEWENIGEKIADAQGWKNRRSDLMNQHHKKLKNKLSIAKEELNPTYLIGFTNGVLNIDTNELLPFDPKYLLTQRLNFPYNPEATCNTWLAWIDWVFKGNETKIELIQALFRWTLEPKDDSAYMAQVCPIAIGESGHGKGTFLQVLKNLLGKGSYGKWTYDSLTDSNSLFNLLHKRGAIGEELKGELSSKMVAKLNSIVSNEEIEVWAKYKDKTSQPLRTVPWGAMNHPIKSKVADKEGLNRRIIYIKFDRKPETVDPRLSRKLAADNSGIFNWVWSLSLDDAVDRINLYLRSDDNVRTQTEYMEDSNTVYEWLKSVELASAQTALLTEWYKRYQAWCSEAGYGHALGRRTWSHQMQLGGSTKGNRTGSGYPLTVPALKNLNTRRMLGIPAR